MADPSPDLLLINSKKTFTLSSKTKSLPPTLSDTQRYKFYEASVQDVSEQCDLLEQFYKEEFERTPLILREDFCGTFVMAVHWVQRGDNRIAVGVDLDSKPLQYGNKVHRAKLSSSERRRLIIKRADVRAPLSPKVDIAVAGNFSFFCLKTRQDLIQYFIAARKSLKSKGALALELAGGPGFVEAPFSEQRSVKKSYGKPDSKKWFTYIWEQKSYDPISRNGLYQITFKMPDGKRYPAAFTYNWRVWTIPEIRECLAEAGFSKSVVYWPTDDDGRAYARKESMRYTDLDTWLAFVVGYK